MKPPLAVCYHKEVLFLLCLNKGQMPPIFLFLYFTRNKITVDSSDHGNILFKKKCFFVRNSVYFGNDSRGKEQTLRCQSINLVLILLLLSSANLDSKYKS